MIFACNEKKADSNLVKEFYDNGNLKRSFVKKDSLIIDTLKEFWPDGQIKEIKVFDTNGIINGIHEVFDQSGKKSFSMFYKNGFSIGYSFDYYEDGKLMGKAFHMGRNQVGNTYHFDIDGKVDAFLFFDFNSKALIEKHYAKDSLVRQRYQSYFIDTIMKSSNQHSINLGIILSRPPHESVKLKFYKINEEHKIYDSVDYISSNEFDSLRITLDSNLATIKMNCTRYDSSNRQETLEDGEIKIK